MLNEFVSIIVPVYNAENYLAQCVDSLIEQTHRNIEIILVDDGSTDRSLEICKEYQWKDSRIIVIHQKNQGAAIARNTGLQQAKGTWIGFADSDDWAEHNLLENLLEAGIRTGADITQTGLIFEYPDSLKQCFFTTDEEHVVSGGARAFSPDDWRLFSNQVYNKLYRREVIGQTRFRPEYVIGEDLIFNQEVLMNADTVTFCAAVGYHYLQRTGSLCHGNPTREQFHSLQRAIEYVSKMWEGIPDAENHFRVETFKNYLDMCYKVAHYAVDERTDQLEVIRNEMRKNICFLLCDKAFSRKEKIKFLMIVLSWRAYSVICRNGQNRFE